MQSLHAWQVAAAAKQGPYIHHPDTIVARLRRLSESMRERRPLPFDSAVYGSRRARGLSLSTSDRRTDMKGRSELTE